MIKKIVHNIFFYMSTHNVCFSPKKGCDIAKRFHMNPLLHDVYHSSVNKKKRGESHGFGLTSLMFGRDMKS